MAISFHYLSIIGFVLEVIGGPAKKSRAENQQCKAPMARTEESALAIGHCGDGTGAFSANRRTFHDGQAANPRPESSDETSLSSSLSPSAAIGTGIHPHREWFAAHESLSLFAQGERDAAEPSPLCQETRSQTNHCDMPKLPTLPT